MASFFPRLPSEVRNEIYRVLLVDEGVLHPTRPKKKLDTNILLASKQIHDEASSILWGENHFSFEYRSLALKCNGRLLRRRLHLSVQTFAQIRHLEILFSKAEALFLSEKTIVSFIESIITSGCILKTFHVVFKFGVLGKGHLPGYEEMRDQEAALKRIAGCTALMNIIGNMKSTNLIEVSVRSFTTLGLRDLDEFAKGLAITKQWRTRAKWRTEELVGEGTFVHTQGSIAEGDESLGLKGLGVNSEHFLGHILYIWTWMLGPTVLDNRK